MDKDTLLLEYLKEQYTQARQHETLRTNSTTLLTAAAGVVLGIAFKDGTLHPQSWWVGIVLILIGLACWRIQEAHFIGNRFHTTAAGITRRTLEDALGSWDVKKPTEIRKEALSERGLRGPNISVGMIVHTPFRWISFGIMALGVVVIVVSRCTYFGSL